jgi:hypothetical protein
MESEFELNSELEQRKEELIKKLESAHEDGELIGDIFYHSMKQFFDLGVELAKDLASGEEED